MRSKGYGSGCGSAAGARHGWECGAGPVGAGPVSAGGVTRGSLLCWGAGGARNGAGGQVRHCLSARRVGVITERREGCTPTPNPASCLRCLRCPHCLHCLPCLPCLRCLPPPAWGLTWAGAAFALAGSPLLLLLLPCLIARLPIPGRP